MRPTREGRTSAGDLVPLTSSYGSDPAIPTTDPPDPIDVAPGGIATIPFLNPGVADVAQFKSGTAGGFGGPVTVTLDNAPTIGNILVLCAIVDDDNGPVLTINNGTWTQAGSTVYSGNGTNWPSRMLYQVVGSGTSAATTVDSSGGFIDTGILKVGIIELTGVDELDAVSDTQTNTATTTATLTPTASLPAVLISATGRRTTGTNVLTPAGGMTEWAEIGASPYGLNYQVIASTSGGYTVGSTGASANSSMIAAAFVDTGIAVNWIDGPLTIDEDDATYEYAFDTTLDETGGAFWRIDLLDTYLISSITAEIGFENAGAATVLLQGANESDFSDATTIESIGVTATGSYTADTLTGSWVPTTAYRYWQLVLSTTSQGVHIFEVSLFVPTPVTSDDIITDHGALTGLTPDDDHLQYELTNEGGQALVQAHGTLGTTETIDPTLGNVHTGTLDANCTITLSAPPATRNGSPAAALIEIRLTEDGTGGWTPTFAASGGSIAWVGGTTPTHTTTLNTLTVYLFETVDGGTTWLGMQVGSASGVTVEDEGTPLATLGTTLDFVGAGVVASGTGAEKTITISGAPAGSAGGDLSGTYPNPSVVDDSHNHSSTTAPGKGAVLLESGHAVPFTFDEILQESDGSDFLYASE